MGEDPGTKEEARSIGRLPFIVAILAAAAGIVFSVMLLIVHRQANTEGGGLAICDVNDMVNCSNVARHEWAKVLGVPTAAWGLLTYTFFAGLALVGLLRKPFPNGPGGILLAAAVPAFGFGAFLMYVMHYEIGSYCIECLGLDAMNILLVVSGLLAVRGRGIVGAIKGDLTTLGTNHQVGVATIGGPLLAGIIVLAFYPRETTGELPRPEADAGFEMPATTPMRGDVRLEGIPCVGPEDAPVVVYEFSDYQCPHCKRAHHEVRQAIEELSESVRFCHFHHPLDNACNPRVPRRFHPHACLAASAGICAQEQGKFWELNDLLFEHGEDLNEGEVTRLARQVRLNMGRFNRCMDSDSPYDRIQHELAESLAVPVEGTPTVVVNGRSVEGAGGMRTHELVALFQLLLENDGQWEGLLEQPSKTPEENRRRQKRHKH